MSRIPISPVLAQAFQIANITPTDMFLDRLYIDGVGLHLQLAEKYAIGKGRTKNIATAQCYLLAAAEMLNQIDTRSLDGMRKLVIMIQQVDRHYKADPYFLDAIRSLAAKKLSLILRDPQILDDNDPNGLDTTVHILIAGTIDISEQTMLAFIADQPPSFHQSLFRWQNFYQRLIAHTDNLRSSWQAQNSYTLTPR